MKYWIKAYVEILNDSKMATLPDRLWRRTLELFLAAGHYDQDGALPDTQQLAWMLRMNTDDLELDLKQIATIGIIQRTTTGWMVTQFFKRQAPTPGAQRIKQFRERNQKRQYNGDSNELVTKSYSETESYTDTEVRALQTAFLNSSGIPAFNTSDIEIYNNLLKAKCIPEDISNAVHTLQSKKYTIKGVQSILTTAINIAKQRVAVPQDGRNIATEEY